MVQGKRHFVADTRLYFPWLILLADDTVFKDDFGAINYKLLHWFYEALLIYSSQNVELVKILPDTEEWFQIWSNISVSRWTCLYYLYYI